MDGGILHLVTVRRRILGCRDGGFPAHKESAEDAAGSSLKLQRARQGTGGTSHARNPHTTMLRKGLIVHTLILSTALILMLIIAHQQAWP